MGVIYVPWPLDKESAAWLDKEGIDHPPVPPESRNPTPHEILAAVSELSDCTAELNRQENGDIDIRLMRDDGAWTTVMITEVRGADLPCSLHFSKGYPELAIEVLRGCTPHCGPIIFYPDTGDGIEVVT